MSPLELRELARLRTTQPFGPDDMLIATLARALADAAAALLTADGGCANCAGCENGVCHSARRKALAAIAALPGESAPHEHEINRDTVHQFRVFPYQGDGTMHCTWGAHGRFRGCTADNASAVIVPGQSWMGLAVCPTHMQFLKP